ncbi:LysE family translocator [Flavobacterium sp.]|uniref:LysE family translocator n=1 Tax=Flavobacterium sp. TaxID=239 RepID=UPI002B4B7D47|nr:LysE family transporter [Flavobacterium sp.]HLP63538.1 LysE family transporter [Flavobacterium sp.]
MTLFLPFFFGFLSAVVGVIPPGLINMTAAKVGITDGRKRAMMFVLGATIIVFLQTYISVMFAQYINQHEEIVVLFREIGLGIFMALSIYFLFFAKEPKINPQEKLQLKSKRSRFFMGMLISALNFFPIPYYVFISVTLASYKLFNFEASSTYSLVFGIVSGSFFVFYCYVLFFEKLQSRTEFLIKNMNKFIGIVTGIVALITLVNVLKFYF